MITLNNLQTTINDFLPVSSFSAHIDPNCYICKLTITKKETVNTLSCTNRHQQSFCYLSSFYTRHFRISSRMTSRTLVRSGYFVLRCLLLGFTFGIMESPCSRQIISLSLCNAIPENQKSRNFRSHSRLVSYPTSFASSLKSEFFYFTINTVITPICILKPESILTV